jgi:hypothetical protein
MKLLEAWGITIKIADSFFIFFIRRNELDQDSHWLDFLNPNFLAHIQISVLQTYHTSYTFIQNRNKRGI